MAGKSTVSVTAEARSALEAMSRSADRGEADRARSIVLTLDGWTSARIAQAFGVREDTVRQWRSDFMRDGVEALRARKAAGPAPVKTQAALRVAGPLLGSPVADRTNWTLARLSKEVERQEGHKISRSQLSKALKKGALSGSARATR